jgi:hypothetical protein
MTIDIEYGEMKIMIKDMENFKVMHKNIYLYNFKYNVDKAIDSIMKYIFEWGVERIDISCKENEDVGKIAYGKLTEECSAASFACIVNLFTRHPLV